ncbi:MAG: flagellar hook protein FlgE [Lachnospiraceae bacterium]|nr:flagellar hook protein FlgE [Lachnospiraceae bacterium]MDE6627031.1 flagellar hook protein FlgE [Lachnospiraceae bacterium]
MMRSLYSGVSGLKTHQTKMDVIGNNIANVNTVGFKSSQVLFKDVLYQTTQRATGANTEGSGGTNAKQIGLGTTTATITVSHKAGSAQSTNNPYDLMINGNSFFIVSREGMNYFTKVGAFNTDDAGNLVTGNGELVMGWQVDPDDPTQIRKDTVSALRPEAEENQTAEPEMTSKAYLSGGIASTDPNLGTADGVPRTVSIYDNLGNAYTVKMTFRENGNEGEYDVNIVSIKDANNNDINGDYDYGFSGTAPDGTATVNPMVTVKFNKDSGTFQYVGAAGSTSATLQITPKGTSDKGNVFQSIINGEPVTGVEFDFSNLKMYSKTKECTYEIHRGSTEGEGGGRKVGKLTDVTIETSGMIYGVYDNGITKLLGQIAIANFVNPAGLEAIGNSLYKETNASGEFDGVGQSIDSVGETMTQGVLEMSNVDLSLEFTEMIVTQRGFQANSRIITVSDTLIEELVNLKR